MPDGGLGAVENIVTSMTLPRSFSFTITHFFNHFKQNIVHTFYLQTTGFLHNKLFKNILTRVFEHVVFLDIEDRMYRLLLLCLTYKM